MKKILFIALILINSYSLFSQKNTGRKYGQISQNELSMSSYESDPTAPAVFLYEDVYIYYEVKEKFRLMKEYSARLKILDNDGTQWANVEIPYYESKGMKEIISNLDANAYNLENGKIVKTSLKKQMVFREHVHGDLKVLKFSIPDVRAGTVIEYKYLKSSDYFFDIPDIEIQHSIPVIYSEATTKIPEWFEYKYNIRSYGYIPVTRSSITEHTRFTSGNEITFRSEVLKFVADSIVALKAAPYIWNFKDHLTKVEFEISGYKFPHQTYKSRSHSWAAVNETLQKSDFGKFLRMDCPFKEDLEGWADLNKDEAELARLVKNYVRSRVIWNGEYRLIGENPRDCWKKGEGSSAAINFLIISGLNHFGIKSVPVLLNPRSYGIMPVSWPTVDNISTFVIMIESDGNPYILEGTDLCSDLNVLSLDLMVDRARIFDVNTDDGWVDLTSLTKNITRHSIIAALSTDGKVNVDHTIFTSNVPSMAVNKEILKARSETKYMEELGDAHSLHIDSIQIIGQQNTEVTRKLKYNMDCEKIGEDLMIKSVLIDFMSTNILTEQQRFLPVQFDHPYNHEITCVIMLPEGYKIQEVPKDVSLSVCDKGISFKYRTQVTGKVLTLKMNLDMERIFYGADDYENLRTFFGIVSDKCSERFVISKE